jgi:hypothetical protein
MFSLSGTKRGEFTYRCHACGWESELTATDQIAAADEAITCNTIHNCALEMDPLPDTKAHKAS